jgi:hypothetical protein
MALLLPEPAMRDQFPTFDHARANEVIRSWGIAQRRAMAREQRGKLDSELFDVPRRTLVGFECYRKVAPEMLRRLVAAGHSPEAIGERMRRPGSRPYFLQLFILMSNFLLSRELWLAEGEVPADEKDTVTVVEFCARVGQAYRRGSLIPEDGTQAILDDEWLQRCTELLVEPSADGLKSAARLAGTLSLYSIILHGEQRDGNFDHGLYEGHDGTQILFREFNDLDNTLMPWAVDVAPPLLSNVIFVYALRDVATSFGLFGECVTDPLDIAPHVLGLATLTREGDEIRRLTAQESAALQQDARTRQSAIYERVTAWSPVQRGEYGLYLYANHLTSWFKLVGMNEVVPEIISRFEEIGKPVAAQIQKLDRIPAVLVDRDGIQGESMFSDIA